MKKDDLLYFLHIRDAIRKILEYTSNVDEQNFLKNSILQDALVRQIEIIGEASNKISVVWDTVRNNIPGLKDDINKIIEELTPQSSLDL